MKTYAIGIRQPDGTLAIDGRDFLADNPKDLLLLVMACEVNGEIDILEYVEDAPCCEEMPWTYEDELKERNMLN